MIRKLAPEDRGLYMGLAKEFYSTDAVMHPLPDKYYEDTFAELMRSPVYTECFILEVDGAPAGYGLISKTYSQEAGGLAVWLEEIYIRPQFRSRGLGSEFFGYVREHVPAARYRLEYEPDNEKALRLYKRWGFTPLPYGQLVNE